MEGYYSNPVKVMVTDVNKKHHQLELLILEGVSESSWVSDMKHIYYYQYQKGKTIKKQDLTPLFRKYFKNIYGLLSIPS